MVMGRKKNKKVKDANCIDVLMCREWVETDVVQDAYASVSSSACSSVRVIMVFRTSSSDAAESRSGSPSFFCRDRKSTRLNSSHTQKSRMPSSA